MAVTPVPSWVPKIVRKCYVTPAVSRVPNAKRGEKKEKWPLHPCLVGAKKRVEMPRDPCILGDSQRQARGAKS